MIKPLGILAPQRALPRESQDIQAIGNGAVFAGSGTTIQIIASRLADLTVGDVLYVSALASTTGTLSISGGTNITWAEVESEQTLGGFSKTQLFRGVVTGVLTAVTITSTAATSNWSVGYAALRGADTTTPEDATVLVTNGINTFSTTVPASAVVTEGSLDLLMVVGDDDNGSSLNPIVVSLTGATPLYSEATNLGDDGTFVSYIRKNASIGAQPDATLTQSPALTQHTAWRIPVRPLQVPAAERAATSVAYRWEQSYNFGLTSYVTSASMNFTADNLAFVLVSATAWTGDPVQPTVTGGGQTTWDLVATIVASGSGNSRQRGWLFRSQQASPGVAAAITATFSVAPLRCGIVVSEVSGVVVGNNGADAFGDTTAVGPLTTTSASVTMAAPLDPRNGVLVAMVGTFSSLHPDRPDYEAGRSSNISAFQTPSQASVIFASRTLTANNTYGFTRDDGNLDIVSLYGIELKAA